MDSNYRSTNIDKIEYAQVVNENKLLRSSFSWMALAMVLTALSAIAFAYTPQLTSLLLEPTEFGGYKPSIFAYIYVCPFSIRTCN